MERQAAFKINGVSVTMVGPALTVGEDAPEFTLQAFDWSLVPVLEQTRDKVRILVAVPTLEEPVYDREMRHFNDEVSRLDDTIVVIGISTDLPYTQERWFSTAGTERMMLLSDHLDTNFGEKYGCLIKERRILRGSVFVVDQKEKIRYASYIPLLGEEPNYNWVIRAAKLAIEEA